MSPVLSPVYCVPYISCLKCHCYFSVRLRVPYITFDLCRFIYKDSIEGINADNIIELYYAANKYEVVRLKEICAQKVKEVISMEKIGDFLEMVCNVVFSRSCHC